MSRQRQSTWLVLFLLAVLEGQVYCINGRVVKSRIGFDEWETYKFNPNSRKLSHDGNKSSRTDTPSSAPSVSFRPTATPAPSLQPSIKPSVSPSRFPSFVPTFPPTDFPTNEPSDMPSIVPSRRPSLGKF